MDNEAAKPKPDDNSEPSSVESPTRHLYRSCTDRMLGGVAGGLAEYLAVDSTIVRLILVLIALAGGAGVLLYILAWLMIPEDPLCQSHSKHDVALDEVENKAREMAEEFKSHYAKQTGRGPRSHQSRRSFGLILVALGLLFLAQEYVNFDIGKLWPVIIILVGLALVGGGLHGRPDA